MATNSAPIDLYAGDTNPTAPNVTNGIALFAKASALPATIANSTAYLMDSAGNTAPLVNGISSFGDSLLTGAVGSTAATAQINPATTSLKGLQSAADKAKQDNLAKGFVNLNDFGVTAASSTTAVATAVSAAIAALPNGGVIFLTELFPIAGTITVATAGITFKGASPNNTGFTTNSTTADMFLVNQWFVTFETMLFATSVNRTAGYCVNSPESGGYSYTSIRHCKFYGSSSLKHWNCINMGATLMDIDDIECRFFANNMIEVNGQSDHRITRAICDNAVQAAGGIVVIKTASLLMANCNIIHAGNGLDITPINAGTVPSLKVINCFFDNCTNGLRFNPTGTGVWYRSQFTNCWFSSCTNAGVLFNSAQFDAIVFTNCDFFGNAVGIDANAGGGEWTVNGGCQFAGNTTAAIRLAASAAHFPVIQGNRIGQVAAFGVNAIGIIIGAGTYTGLIIQGNDVNGNTTAATFGAVTVTTWANYRISDNAGINPKGAVTTPAVPGTGVATTNTTGYRVVIAYKTTGTIHTAFNLNGVAFAAPNLQPINTLTYLTLDPGGTITWTGGTAPTWVWVGN